MTRFVPKNPEGGETCPNSPPPYRRRRLDTLAKMRRELTNLYHEAREGTVEPADASKLTSILATAGRMIEGSEIEARLAEVERRLKDGDR
jgi:hypothetical protein